MKVPGTPRARTLAGVIAGVAILVAVVIVTTRGDDADPAAERAQNGSGRSTTVTSGGDRTTESTSSSTATTGSTAPGSGTTTTVAGGGEPGGTAATEPGTAPTTTAPAQGPIRDQPCTPTGPPTIELPIGDGDGGAGGEWVTVASASGNCGGRSEAFATTAVDTRVLYRSDAEQMLVFLDDVADPDASAGYADVECRTRCAGTQDIVSAGGQYRIRVNATDGPWEVLVQEYR